MTPPHPDLIRIAPPGAEDDGLRQASSDGHLPLSFIDGHCRGGAEWVTSIVSESRILLISPGVFFTSEQLKSTVDRPVILVETEAESYLARG